MATVLMEKSSQMPSTKALTAETKSARETLSQFCQIVMRDPETRMMGIQLLFEYIIMINCDQKVLCEHIKLLLEKLDPEVVAVLIEKINGNVVTNPVMAALLKPAHPKSNAQPPVPPTAVEQSKPVAENDDIEILDEKSKSMMTMAGLSLTVPTVTWASRTRSPQSAPVAPCRSNTPVPVLDAVSFPGLPTSSKSTPIAQCRPLPPKAKLLATVVAESEARDSQAIEEHAAIDRKEYERNLQLQSFGWVASIPMRPSTAPPATALTASMVTKKAIATFVGFHIINDADRAYKRRLELVFNDYTNNEYLKKGLMYAKQNLQQQQHQDMQIQEIQEIQDKAQNTMFPVSPVSPGHRVVSISAAAPTGDYKQWNIEKIEQIPDDIALILLPNIAEHLTAEKLNNLTKELADFTPVPNTKDVIDAALRKFNGPGELKQYPRPSAELEKLIKAVRIPVEDNSLIINAFKKLSSRLILISLHLESDTAHGTLGLAKIIKDRIDAEEIVDNGMKKFNASIKERNAEIEARKKVYTTERYDEKLIQQLKDEKNEQYKIVAERREKILVLLKKHFDMCECALNAKYDEELIEVATKLPEESSEKAEEDARINNEFEMALTELKANHEAAMIGNRPSEWAITAIKAGLDQCVLTPKAESKERSERKHALDNAMEKTKTVLDMMIKKYVTEMRIKHNTAISDWERLFPEWCSMLYPNSYVRKARTIITRAHRLVTTPRASAPEQTITDLSRPTINLRDIKDDTHFKWLPPATQSDAKSIDYSDKKSAKAAKIADKAARVIKVGIVSHKDQEAQKLKEYHSQIDYRVFGGLNLDIMIDNWKLGQKMEADQDIKIQLPCAVHNCTVPYMSNPVWFPISHTQMCKYHDGAMCNGFRKAAYETLAERGYDVSVEAAKVANAPDCWRMHMASTFEIEGKKVYVMQCKLPRCDGDAHYLPETAPKDIDDAIVVHLIMPTEGEDAVGLCNTEQQFDVNGKLVRDAKLFCINQCKNGCQYRHAGTVGTILVLQIALGICNNEFPDSIGTWDHKLISSIIRTIFQCRIGHGNLTLYNRLRLIGFPEYIDKRK